MSTQPISDRATGRPPADAGRLGALVRQVPYYTTVLRRTWRGSIFSYAILPVIVLASFGVGLGSFVAPDRTASLGGLSYLDFVAPGILAVSALTAAAGESTYPVYAMFHWTKMGYAMSSTSLRAVDVLNGVVAYVAVRTGAAVVVLTAVLVAFGTVASAGGAVLLVAVGVLIAVAHATPIIAYTAHATSDGALTLVYRLAIVPMTLFSGAYFPISQLPAAVRAIAYVTPAWHGVELARMCSTDRWAWSALLHVAYLVAFAVAGWWVARRIFTRRLEGQ